MSEMIFEMEIDTPRTEFDLELLIESEKEKDRVENKDLFSERKIDIFESNKHLSQQK